MQDIAKGRNFDTPLFIGIVFLVTFSILVLNSIASFLFPLYFLYVLLGFIAYYVFSQIDFEIISLFCPHLYLASVVFLIIPLLIGQATRGAVRWIPLGALTIQPAEIVRPFLLVFFANYIVSTKLNYKRLIKAFILLSLPVLLILIQPSLGVAILTIIAFTGVLLASGINKKYIFLGVGTIVFLLPLFWQVLAPYQKQRVETFLKPESDPFGTGYNSIQSMISIGSGKIFGKGLGKGAQTQLAFLPEKHTDFIFAAISEEMGFVGASLVIIGVFFLIWRLTIFMEASVNPSARAYIAGVFLTLFVQSVINIGMNLGWLPITGLPLPLVSAGGSSFLGTMVSLGIAVGSRKRV
jgi:rod shape determining protein RodA